MKIIKYFIHVGGGSAEVGIRSVRSSQTHQALDTPVFAHSSKGYWEATNKKLNPLMNTVTAAKHILFLPSILPPNRGPLDCAGGTLQEAMKVMFEFLGKMLWLSWQQTAKSTTKHKPLTITLSTFELQLCTSYSHVLHILSSHILLAVDTTTKNSMIV